MSNPVAGEYYQSHEPLFGWMFLITKVHEDGSFIALGHCDESYCFERGHHLKWEKLDRSIGLSTFTTKMRETLQWYSDWHDDRS